MKTSKTMITLKSFYILTTILGLQFNMIIAGNLNSGSSYNTTELNTAELITLAPATPKEADFSDVAPESGNELKNLAPLTPKEAEFEEATGTSATKLLINLMPELPSEADFSDGEVNQSMNINLAPSTPSEADFEDLV